MALLCLCILAWLASALISFAQLEGSPLHVRDWNLTAPLRVCTSSIQDFGARCNGSPDPSFEGEVAPNGPVPVQGWCGGWEDFCGYDVTVWRDVAEDLGLLEGTHYEHVCMGELGFGLMIDSLAGINDTFGACDIGVSAITASVERQEMGITFSRATHRSSLAILVHATLNKRGMWAFLDPLYWDVWAVLLATVFIVPIFICILESVFSSQSVYTKPSGAAIAHGMKEAMWHSISHTLSIDVFKVKTVPSRIITMAYAFVVLIVTNTYTANLAAFLTVDQLDTSVQGAEDLVGAAVVSVTPYLRRLYVNHRITAVDNEEWDYDAMISKLLSGQYKAVISDDTQLVPRAYADKSCELHVLDERIEPFDLAFAFRNGFPYMDLRNAVSASILRLQESGRLAEIEDMYQPPEPVCGQFTEYNETNQVRLRELWGLWIILAAFIALAFVVAIGRYLYVRGHEPQKHAEMNERARLQARSLSSMARVGRIVDVWQGAAAVRRKRGSSASNELSDAGVPAARARWRSAGRNIALNGVPPPSATEPSDLGSSLGSSYRRSTVPSLAALGSFRGSMRGSMGGSIERGNGETLAAAADAALNASGGSGDSLPSATGNVADGIMHARKPITIIEEEEHEGEGGSGRHPGGGLLSRTVHSRKLDDILQSTDNVDEDDDVDDEDDGGGIHCDGGSPLARLKGSGSSTMGPAFGAGDIREAAAGPPQHSDEAHGGAADARRGERGESLVDSARKGDDLMLSQPPIGIGDEGERSLELANEDGQPELLKMRSFGGRSTASSGPPSAPAADPRVEGGGAGPGPQAPNELQAAESTPTSVATADVLAYTLPSTQFWAESEPRTPTATRALRLSRSLGRTPARLRSFAVPSGASPAAQADGDQRRETQGELRALLALVREQRVAQTALETRLAAFLERQGGDVSL